MSKDYIYLGSSPTDESCAQVGTANYSTLSTIELSAYRNQIIRCFGNPPEGTQVLLKDGEVVICPSGEDGWAWGGKIEGECPECWDEQARKEIEDAMEATRQRAKDTTTPTWCGTPAKVCCMKEAAVDNMPCRGDGTITTEFVDGRIKGMGQWGNMCPACFGVYGAGLGTGCGQRYVLNETDGKFHKVEG